MPELPTRADTCTCRTKRSDLSIRIAPCVWHAKYRRAVRAKVREQKQRAAA